MRKVIVFGRITLQITIFLLTCVQELTICTFSITKSTDKTLKIILAKLSKIVLKIDISTSIFIPFLVKNES